MKNLFGIVAVCTLDYTVETTARRIFWRKLFAHMGVKSQTVETTGGPGKKKEHDLLLDGPQN